MLLLLEIQSEPKLNRLLRSLGAEQEARLLRHAIAGSLTAMLSDFRQKCIQHAPHINYMQPPPLARVSCSLLLAKVVAVKASESLGPPSVEQLDVARAVASLMACIRNVEQTALIYIDARLMEKFVGEHLLRQEHLPPLMAYLGWLAGVAKQILAKPTRQESEQDALGVLLATVDALLLQPRIWRELNASLDAGLRCELLDLLGSVARCILQDTIFYQRHRLDRSGGASKGSAPQAIFLAKLIETQIDIESLDSGRVLAGGGEDARLQFVGQELAQVQVPLVSDIGRPVICQSDPAALSLFCLSSPVAGGLHWHFSATHAPLLCLRGDSARAHPAAGGAGAAAAAAEATGRWQAAHHSRGQSERCGCPAAICQAVS